MEQEIIIQKDTYRVICYIHNDENKLVYKLQKIYTTIFGDVCTTFKRVVCCICEKTIMDRKVKNIINCLNAL